MKYKEMMKEENSVLVVGRKGRSREVNWLRGSEGRIRRREEWKRRRV